MKHTMKMKLYILKFMVRLGIFAVTFFLYLTRREWIISLMTQNIRYGISFVHILWIIFMVTMLLHLFPSSIKSMALLKMKEEKYEAVEGYSELELYRYFKKQNERAWVVMLLWFSFNAIWGFLYLFHVIESADLFMLSVFYFLCDYICILFYCPFQTNIMKNKCCVNCRIYDWGHFMMFTPMLFIRNFFSWSLFFTSLIVLIRWEIIYARHPERFSSISNKKLKCENCLDRTCRIKNKLAKSE